jgi:hypothetical protein
MFNIFPFSGRMACVLLSLPNLALPAAESPSTMYISQSLGFLDAQSASLPGSIVLVRRDLRRTYTHSKNYVETQTNKQ